MRQALGDMLRRLSASAGWLKRAVRGKRDGAAAARPGPPLVKARPASLEQRYEIVREDELADEAFRRLQARVFATLDQHAAAGGKTIFREAGRLGPRSAAASYSAPGRLYFYVKPAGAPGYLVERSGSGWLVTGAEKIVARALFLRDEAPLDHATLFAARAAPEAPPVPAALPRVRTQAAGEALLAFSVYEQRLLDQLGLA